MSGLTYAGGSTYYTIAESPGATGKVESWCLYRMSVSLDDAGTKITGITLENGGVAVEGCTDLEAVAYDPASGNVWCTDETAKTIGEYDPTTGKRIRLATFPDFLRDSYGGYWCEGLTISGDGLTMWAANEEALKCDDTRSSYQKGTTVRLVKFTRATLKDEWQCVAMYAYVTDKWHQRYSYGTAGRRGVSDLAALPDGSLLVMERELSASSDGTDIWAGASVTLRLSIYRVTPAAFAAATNVRDVTSLSQTGGWSSVDKQVLWGSAVNWANYEGCCLGPRISDSQCAFVALTDAGDSDWLDAEIRPFVLSGLNVHTLSFARPAYGTSSVVGTNFRYLDGAQVQVSIDGTAGKSPYATDGTRLASCSGWTLSNHSPAEGTGESATFAVSADGTFAWKVSPVTASGGYHVADSFERELVGAAAETLAGWSGEVASVKRRAYSPPVPPGYVMTKEPHAQVLDVARGVATRLLSAADKEDRIDTMICFTPADGPLGSVPDEELLRLAAGPDNRLYLWHLYVEDGRWKRGWSPLSDTVHAAGEWLRLEIDFDYSGSRDGDAFARIRINGSCQPTAHGVRSPSDPVPYGPWHYLARNRRTGGTVRPKELTFLGTEVDDLMMCARTVEPEHTGATSVDGIDFTWFDAAGLPRNPKYPAPFVAGYTLADIHTAGMDPYSARPFEVTEFAIEGDGKVRMTFNGYRGETPDGFRVHRSATPDFADAAVLGSIDGAFHGDPETGLTTWIGTVSAEDPGVGFYRVEAYGK